ncbi:DNA pilot protein [Tortoise microvirus 11]|nr:DNA pilot protein [Tortoise microvirus 11]
MSLGLGIAGAAIQAAGTIGSLIGSKKKQKRAYDLQGKLNAEQAKMNYEYGELAAQSAHGRSLELQRNQFENQSLVNQVADAQEAGLSPGIFSGLGGGGGSGGSGAQGGGARGLQAADIAAIMAAENERRSISIEGARASAEKILQIAEANKIKAETEQIKSDTETSTNVAEANIEKISQEIQESLQRQGRFDEKTTAEITNLMSQAEAGTATARLSEALERLNNEKVKGYWMELLNTIRQTDINEADLENKKINAEANRLASIAAYMNAETGRESSENPGSFSNVKTWKRAIEDFVEECHEPNNIIGGLIFGRKIKTEKIKEIGEKALKKNK